MTSHSKILIIETSSDLCSVALLEDDMVIGAEQSSTANDHAACLASLTDRLLESNDTHISDLDAVAVSAGPGSYTGLRIGIAFAKGLVITQDTQLIKVDLLDALVLHAMSIGITVDIYCPAIDARRSEVYMKQYNRATPPLVTQSTNAESVIFDEKTIKLFLDESSQTVCFLGSGAHKIESLLSEGEHISFDLCQINASFLGNYVHQCWTEKKFENVFSLTPFYFKPPNITQAKNTII